ncbi:hypothetical protein [Tenacibaculum mesophilum]|uniref:hypothetical protein n=1 Tax=Tenacibaculum mesophilum TaxID=104268 RepID=UPI00064AE877|nr:hypothetical protein [Tenacibaculum mesophilum]
MNKTLKISLIIVLLIGTVLSFLLWRFLGKPYYKINLIGTEYIENSEELRYVNEQLKDNLYLIKKYKHSKDTMLIDFGGGGSKTEDYYSYGIADKNKNILLKPKYQFLYTKTNSHKELIIYGLPYVEKGNEKMMFYKIVNGQLELIKEESSW